MKGMILSSTYFGVLLTIAAFEIGQLVKKKVKIAIANPLLVAIALIIAVLVTCNISYGSYSMSTRYLTYLLTPATVCLAVPLHERFHILKQNAVALLAGIISGVLTSLVSVFGLSLLLGFNHRLYVTVLPKSITTAIGMGVSEELGGYVTITVAVIVLTGIFGNMFAEIFAKIFHITDPVAKGIAIGSSSHAIGTAKAMELGETEGAMSSLSLAVSGVITVFIIMPFANLI